MKKRILALALTLAMLLSMLPAQVFATGPVIQGDIHTEHNFEPVTPPTPQEPEETPEVQTPSQTHGEQPPKRGTTHSHYMSADPWNTPGSSGEQVVFNNSEWSNTTVYESCNYVLNQDKSLMYFQISGGPVNICLNGHTLTLDAMMSSRCCINLLTSGVAVNICDCKGGGKVVVMNSYYHPPVYFRANNTVLNLYGGTLETAFATVGTNSATIVASTTGNQANLFGGSVIAAGLPAIKVTSNVTVTLDGTLSIDSESQADIYFADDSVVYIEDGFKPDGNYYSVAYVGTVAAGEKHKITSGWDKANLDYIPFESAQGYVVKEFTDDSGATELYLTVPELTTKVNGQGSLIATDADGNNVTSILGGTKVYFEPVTGEGSFVENIVLTYTNRGKVVTETLTPNADGKYEITMPAADVTVTATFNEPHRHHMAVDTEKGSDVDTDIVNFNCVIDSEETLYKYLEESSDKTAYDLKAGNYVINAELVKYTGEKEIRIQGDVNLCLNGGTLDLGTSKLNQSNGTFNICDCRGDGKITSSFQEYTVKVSFTSGPLHLYGGTVESTSVDSIDNKYCTIYATRQVFVHGGSVSNVNNSGIYVLDGGDLTILGGSVRGKENAIKTSTREDNRVTISDGTITSDDIAIAFSYGTLLIDGEGAHISANTALNVEGNLRDSEVAKATITAGTLIGESCGIKFSMGGTLNISGTASVTGGDAALRVNMNKAIATVSGGTFTSTHENSAAIRVESGTFNLSGDPVINGGSGKPDIYLANGKVVTITGALTGTDTYSVVVATPPVDDTTTVPITQNWPNSGSDKKFNNTFIFTSANSDCGVKLVGAEYDKNTGALTAGELHFYKLHRHDMSTTAAVSNQSVTFATSLTEDYLSSIAVDGVVTLTTGAYVLEENITENPTGVSSYVINGNVDLCLKNYTWQIRIGINTVVVNSGSKLRICSCSSSGTISIHPTVTVNGELEIYGGNIAGSSTVKTLTVANGGSAKIYGGTVSIRTNGQTNETIMVEAGGNLYIYGGTVSGANKQVINNQGTVTIDGENARVETATGERTVYCLSGGKLILRKGLISHSTGNGVLVNGGTVEIYGGTITGGKYGIHLSDDGSTLGISGAPEITGTNGDISFNNKSTVITVLGNITAPAGAYSIVNYGTVNQTTGRKLTTGWNSFTGNAARRDFPFADYTGTYAVRKNATDNELYFMPYHRHFMAVDTGNSTTGNKAPVRFTVELTKEALLDMAVNGTIRLETGAYVLMETVTDLLGISAIEIRGDVDLCLYGNTLDLGTTHLKVRSTGTLDLCDCLGTGKITGNYRPVITETNVDFAHLLDNEGTFRMYGGTIDIKDDAPVDSAGEVAKFSTVNNKGSFELLGGTITSPYNYYTVVNLKNDSKMTVSGGSIGGQKAIHNIGILDIKGGTISTSGIALILDGGVTTISAGEIISSDGSAVIFCQNANSTPTVNLFGGKIINNNSKNGRGIRVINPTVFNMSGSPEITHHYYAISLEPEGQVINVVGEITGTYCLITGTKPTETAFVKITDGWSTHEANTTPFHFTSYDKAYEVIKGEDGELYLAQFHKHYMAVDWEFGHEDKGYVHADGTEVGEKVTFATCLTSDYVQTLSTYDDQHGDVQYGLETGFYVLTDDLSVDKSISIRGTVNLCLNGHTLDLGDHAIVFNTNGNLNICDCKGTGKITSTDYNSTIRYSFGTLNIYGGTIEHPVAYDANSPVYDEDGVLILPSVIRCNSKLNIYGGTIHSDHHGIYTLSADSSEVQIFDGVIEGVNGSGVFVGACKSVDIKGENVRISGRTALTAMGGDITVTAGTLSSTLSNSIYIDGGNVTVRSASVINGRYSAIAILDGTLSLADAPTIESTGNYASIQLGEGMVINVLGEIGGTYSVITNEKPTENAPVRITSNWTNSGSTTTEDNSFVLTSADAQYPVRLRNNELWLVMRIAKDPMSLYLRKDISVTVTEDALIDVIKTCDSEGLLFKENGSYTVTSIELEANSSMSMVKNTDGTYTFRATVAGKIQGKLTVSFLDNYINMGKSGIVNVIANVYDVMDSVYVLDYNGTVKLSDSMFANDTLPGTAYGLTAEQEPYVNMAYETFTDVMPTLGQNGLTMTLNPTDGKGNYGLFAISEDGSLVTYTVDSFLNGVDDAYLVFRAYGKGSTPGDMGSINPFNEVELYKQIKVLPANVIYYEDNFSALTYGTGVTMGTENKIKILGNENVEIYQDPTSGNYGNDSSYLTPQENGSGNVQHEITVNGFGTVLSFNFVGTGFDLIGRSTADSGSLIIMVYKADGTLVYSRPLDTIFMEPGGAIYESALVHVADLEHGSYRVEVMSVPIHDYSGAEPKIVPSYLYIDGVRIYNTLDVGNKDRNDYYAGGEKDASFVEIRNLVLRGQAASAKVENNSFTFGSGTISYTQTVKTGTKKYSYTGNKVSSANDYLLAGPNNALYMNDANQAIVFYVKAQDSQKASMLQIGIRDLNDTAFDSRDSDTDKTPILQFLAKDGEQSDVIFGGENAKVGYTEQYYTVDLSRCVTEVIGGNTYYRVVLMARNNAALAMSNVKYSNLDFYTIPGLATTLIYDKTGQLIETADPNADELPNLQQLAWQMQTAAGLLPEDELESEATTLNFAAISLSLKSSIGMNYYVLAEDLKDLSEPYIVVTVDEVDSAGNYVGTDTYTVTTYDESTTGGKDYLVFRMDEITAKEMNANIQATLYAKDAEGNLITGETRIYNPRTYAENMLKKDNTAPALRTLLTDMLNYGAAAQIHFNYNYNGDVTRLANYGIDQTNATKTDPRLNIYTDTGMEGNDYPILINAVSISLKDTVEVNFYVKVPEGIDISKLAVRVVYRDLAGIEQIKDLTCEQEGTTDKLTQMKIPMDDLTASEMRTILNAWVTYDGALYSNMITYSIESYAASQIAKDDPLITEAMKTLLREMMKYGDSTRNYFLSLQPTNS